MVDVEILQCKCNFGVVRMSARIPWDLDMYPIVDQRHLKMINTNYSVRVGYWASRNKV
jgi:hypothetical protein